MNDFDDSLYSLLSGIAGLTAISSDRIYPLQVPQGVTYPLARFESDVDGGFKDFDGQGGTIQANVQLDFLAVTKAEASEMASAVRTALKNYTGAFGASHTITSMFLESTYEGYEPSIQGGMYRASQAWRFWAY